MYSAKIPTFDNLTRYLAMTYHAPRLVNSDKTLPRELAQGSPYMTMRSDLQTL